MAKTLAQLQMPESSKIKTTIEESIGMLLKMTQSYNVDKKESALGALENLSTARHVYVLMTTAKPSGPELLVPLITATKTSSNVKVVASRVIENIMTSLAHNWEPAEDKDEQVEWLVCTLLQLLNPFAPAAVHAQVLLGLLGVANGADTGPFLQAIMKDQVAFPALIPFLKMAMEPEVKENAVKMFASLSTTYAVEASSILKQSNCSISNIVDIQRKESRADTEQIATVRILANLPVDDSFVTTALLQADFIPVVVKFLNNNDSKMEEAAAGALLRFTSPALKDMQLKLAAAGVIQLFVTLLDSMSSLTKKRAALALANFSQNSLSLMKPLEQRNCLQCFTTPVNFCPVHLGRCNVETSFCLKEADAIGPLVAILKEAEPVPCEAALAALLTMLDDPLESPKPGCHLIAKAKGIPAIIPLLNISGKFWNKIPALIMKTELEFEKCKCLFEDCPYKDDNTVQLLIDGDWNLSDEIESHMFASAAAIDELEDKIDLVVSLHILAALGDTLNLQGKHQLVLDEYQNGFEVAEAGSWGVRYPGCKDLPVCGRGTFADFLPSQIFAITSLERG